MPPLPCVSTAARLFSPTTTTTTASTRRLRLGGVQDVSLITSQYLHVNISAGSDGGRSPDAKLQSCFAALVNISDASCLTGLTVEDLYCETSAGSVEFYLLRIIM